MTKQLKRIVGAKPVGYVWDPTHTNRPRKGIWRRTTKGWTRSIPKTKLEPIFFDEDRNHKPSSSTPKMKLAPISFDNDEEQLETARKVIPKTKLEPISFDDDKSEPSIQKEDTPAPTQTRETIHEDWKPLRSKSHSSVLGWYEDIETGCDALMYKISGIVGSLMDSIEASGGSLIPYANSELAKVENEIMNRTAALDANRDVQNSLMSEIKSTESKWKAKLEEMSSLQNKAEKYMMEKDLLRNFTPGTKGYKEQQNRIRLFKESYDRHEHCMLEADELYSRIQELKDSLDKAEAEGRRFKKIPGVRDDELHYINVSLKNYRDRLLEMKKNLDGVTALGCEENRQRFMDVFADRKNRDTFAAKTYSIIQNVVNGAFTNMEEFSDDQKNEFLECIFKFAEDDDDEWRRFNPFVILASNSEYVKTDDSGEDRVFDMSDVPSLDIFRVFCNYAGGYFWTSCHNALKRMKNKREMFVRDIQQSDDDDEYSIQETSRQTVPLEEKKDYYSVEKKIINPETQSYAQSLKSKLDSEMDAMGATVAQAVRKQLSPKAYFNKITPSAAKSELKRALQMVLNSVFYELVAGRSIEGKMKDIVKHALGGSSDYSEFEIIYKVMYATLELHISQKLKETYVKDASEEARENDPKTLYIIQKLDRKINQAKRGIQDASVVQLAEKIHRNARAVVKSLDEEQEASSQAVDDRVEFLLDGRRLPDGSAKCNSK